MKLTEELKNKVEQAENKEEAKAIIKDACIEAGIEITDDEVEQIAGGYPIFAPF